MVINKITRSFLPMALFLPALLMANQLQARENHVVKLQRLIDEHTLVIQNTVVNSWNLPPVFEEKLSKVVAVTVTTKGVITESHAVNSSGNTEFDRSVETAVTNSSPLPVATDPEVMDQFRQLKFEFRFGDFESPRKKSPVNKASGYTNYPHVKSPIYIDK